MAQPLSMISPVKVWVFYAAMLMVPTAAATAKTIRAFFIDSSMV